MGKIMKVEKMVQTDEGFWFLMGPFFASAKVKRELGIAMSSDESYTWFLALDKGEVLGFCAMTKERKGSRLRHVYVVEEHRKRKVATQVVGVALTMSLKPISLTVKADDVSFYEKMGFSAAGKGRGSYVEMVR